MMPATRKFSEGFADTHNSEGDSDHDMSDISCDVIDVNNSPCVVLERRPYMEHQASSPQLPFHGGRGTDQGRTNHTLTTTALLAFCFFATSGGPTGSEDLILVGGPFVGLVALVLFPIVFYLPVASMVTELATSIPARGGDAYWIALAFGPSWGFQAGYWCWTSNCIDCTMYASIAIAALAGPSASTTNTFWAFLAKATFAILLALPGLWSLRAVGNVALGLSVFVLVPYAVVSLWAAVEADHWSALVEVRQQQPPPSPPPGPQIGSTGEIDIDWSRLITTLVWSYSGFTNLSVLAAHVHDPLHSYTQVLWISSVLVPLAYIIPYATLAAVGSPPWQQWEDGSLGDVAQSLGGPGMATWVMAVDLFSSAGLYICSLTASVYLANGMAQQGIAPKTIGLSTSSGTPHGAICCSLAVILVLLNLELDEMLLLSSALGGLEAIAFLLASVRLRFTQKELHRPFKFCGDAHVSVVVLLLILPLVFYVITMCDALSSFKSAVLTVVFLFIGVVYARQADYTTFRLHIEQQQQQYP